MVVYQDQSQVAVCCLVENEVDPEEALDYVVVDYQVHLDDHHLEPKGGPGILISGSMGTSP